MTERGLAERLGVSPTPVREAVSRLLHERLLVRVAGRTLQVAAPNLDRLREMSLIQSALRGVAARLAAESASESELDAIATAHQATLNEDATEAAELEPNKAAQLARHDFHQLIIEASHSPSLLDMIATAEAFGRPMRERAQGASGAVPIIRHAVDEHQEILEALLARDGQRAEDLMRHHSEWVNDQYLSFAKQELTATENTGSQGRPRQSAS